MRRDRGNDRERETGGRQRKAEKGKETRMTCGCVGSSPQSLAGAHFRVSEFLTCMCAAHVLFILCCAFATSTFNVMLGWIPLVRFGGSRLGLRTKGCFAMLSDVPPGRVGCSNADGSRRLLQSGWPERVLAQPRSAALRCPSAAAALCHTRGVHKAIYQGRDSKSMPSCAAERWAPLAGQPGRAAPPEITTRQSANERQVGAPSRCIHAVAFVCDSIGGQSFDERTRQRSSSGVFAAPTWPGPHAQPN